MFCLSYFVCHPCRYTFYSKWGHPEQVNGDTLGVPHSELRFCIFFRGSVILSFSCQYGEAVTVAVTGALQDITTILYLWFKAISHCDAKAGKVARW